MKITKNFFIGAALTAVLAAAIFVLPGIFNQTGETDERDAARQLLGNPAEFAIEYLPAGTEEQPLLVRAEVWFYPKQGKKITFLNSRVLASEDYAPQNANASGTSLAPDDFDFDMNADKVNTALATDKIETFDGLAGFYDENGAQTYLSDKALFVIEDGKLTYFHAFGMKNGSASASAGTIMPIFGANLVQTAEARGILKDTFRCVRKVCRFVVNAPAKITRPLGPVLGPLAELALTQHISGGSLARYFSAAQRGDKILTDVEEQKKAVAEAQKMYRDFAADLDKRAAQVRDGKKQLEQALLERDITLNDYMSQVVAVDKMAGAYENAAASMRNSADRLKPENLIKIIGRNFVEKTIGDIKRIVMTEVGREFDKFINPNILTLLFDGKQNGLDAVIDLLAEGDIDAAIKSMNLSGNIDMDAVRERVRSGIKDAWKNNRDNLKNNWKAEVTKIINQKIKELEDTKKLHAQDNTGNKKTEKPTKPSIALPQNFYDDPADKCKPGYKYSPKSGIDCIQENCYTEAVANAHWSYEGYCVCGSSGSISENPADPNKECSLPGDFAACPGCVYACVGNNEECPAYKF